MPDPIDATQVTSEQADAFPEPGTVVRDRPPFVRTPEDARRWDACELIANAMVESAEDEGDPQLAGMAWQFARSLYGSDIPTDDVGDAEGA